MKALFAKREDQLQAEMQRLDLQHKVELHKIQAHASAAEAEAKEHANRADVAEKDKRGAEAEAASANVARQKFADELSACAMETEHARAQKERIEGEMRLVIKAMDAQKHAAATNIQQLSKIYDEWSHSMNNLDWSNTLVS